MRHCGAESRGGYECTLRLEHDGAHEAWGIRAAGALKVWGRHASDLPVDLRPVALEYSITGRHSAEGVLA